MSWSVTGILTGANDAVTTALRDLRTSALIQNPDATDQVDAALIAARALFNSGAVGSPDRRYTVRLMGHANPGHAPRPGWTNDCVTVTLEQLPESAS